MNAFFAFLHHVAAVTLVAALAIEYVLIKGELTIASARKLQLADLAFGVSAGVVLVIGSLRVFYFEKGPSYYFHSAPFIGKLSLFVLIGLLSIYPTVQFLSWRSSLKARRVPVVEARTLRTIRAVVHLELAAVVFILLFAALMARGMGLMA
jgi:putative membrane protein